MAVDVRGAKVRIGSKISGTVDLRIGAGGVSGQAVFESKDIKIGGLVLKGGYLRVAVLPCGEIEAHGRLTAEVKGFGEVTVEACYADGEFKGKISAAWTRPFPIAPGVRVERLALKGCFREGAWSIRGEVDLDLLDGRFGAKVAATYFRAGEKGEWEFEGSVHQKKGRDIVFGDLHLTKGRADIVYERGRWQPAHASFEFIWRQVKGSVKGTYDFDTRLLDARGEAHLEQPLPFGRTGVQLDKASLELVVEDNVPVTLEGDAKLTLPYQGLATFEIAAHAKVDLQTELVDAEGTATVLRDVCFGNPGGLNAVIAKGGNGGFEMSASAITHLGGDLSFSVNHGEHQVGEGAVTLDGGDTSSLNGAADFSLTHRTGLPDVAAGPLFLLPGGSFHLPIEASQLGKAQAVDVRWELCHPAGTGKVEGSVAGHYDFQTGDAALHGDAEVVETWTAISAAWGELRLTKGGQGQVGVESSRLAKLGGSLPFELTVHPIGPVPGFELEGEIEADVAPESWEVTGAFSASLRSDLVLPLGGAGDTLRVAEGSTFDGTVAKSQPEQLGLAIDASIHRAEGGELLAGSIASGHYDVKRGKISFAASLTLKQAIDVPVGAGWKVRVEPEVTNLECEVADSALVRVGGDIELTLWDGAEPLLEGALTDADVDLTQATPQLSGDLRLQLARDLQVPKGGEGLPPAVSFTALTTSKITGHIQDNSLEVLNAELHIDGALHGDKVGEINLGGTWDLYNDQVTGQGELVLIEDVALGAAAAASAADPTGWQLVMLMGSRVAVALEANTLQPATVAIGVGLRRDAGDVALGDVTGVYLFGDEGGFTGQIAFHMVEDLQIGEAAGFTIHLGGRTKATGEIAANRVTSAQGVFQLLAKEGGEDMLSATLEASWAGGPLSGQASVEALDEVFLGHRVIGGHVFEVHLAEGSAASIQIADNAFGLASGELTLLVSLDGLSFARGTFAASYDFSVPESTVSATGALEIIGAATLGRAGLFTFDLEAGSGISGAIEDNALSWLEGQLVVGMKTDAEGRVGSLSLQGRYEGGAEPDFGGQAAAVIDKEFLLGYSAWGYEFGFGPSAFGVILDRGQIVQAGGSFEVYAVQSGSEDEAPLGTMRVALSGDYARPYGAAEGSFTGAGTCSVDGQLRVGQAADFELYVTGGSGIQIDVEDNRFTRLHGDLNARVDLLSPGQGEDKSFLTLDTEVTYVPTDGGRVDANGSAGMIGHKRLLALNGYEFWLIPGEGTGASVEIVDNTVVSVGGNVSAAVYDGHDQPLIRAHAQGTWFRETNLFNGSGDIRLGREISFPDTDSGPRVVFHAGSGGSGVVENNLIKRLAGRLIADIHDGTGPVVRIDGEGEYDAVANDVVQAGGTVTLLRPIVIGDASDPLLVIESAAAQGVIEHSELIGINGRMAFAVPRLWDMRGDLDGGWTQVDGENQYWGDAHIDFCPIDDPDNGRKLEGAIDGSFAKDGTWQLSGDVDYQMTPYLKTKAHVALDNRVDPEISAGFDLDKQPVLDEAALFSLDLPLFKVNFGIVQAGINAGIGLSSQPLLFSTKIEVQRWRPLSEMSEVPDFEADLGVDWGLDFSASLAAWICLGLDIEIASFGAGVEGGAELNLNVPLHLGGKLRGGADGFGGQLDLQVALEAFITLFAKPFVKAEFLWWDWRKDWPLEYQIGPIFEWQWGTSYEFGDNPAGPKAIDASANTHKAQGGSRKSVKSDAKAGPPKLAEDKAPQALPQKPGAPAMNPAAESKGADKAPAKDGLPGGMGEKMDKFAPILDALAEMGPPMGILKPAFAFIRRGIAGMVLLVLAVFFDPDFPSWDDLASAVGDIMKVLGKVWAVVQDAFDLDFETKHFLNAILQEKPDLLDALFGADDAVRAEVDKGTHLDLPPKGRARFIEIMMDGYCGDADEDRILEILRNSSGAEIKEIVSRIEGGSDRMLYKLDGRQDDELREIFDRHGIDY